MQKQTKFIIYLAAIVIVFSLGGWAYNEVAVKNRPPSPDEIIEAETTTQLAENNNPNALKQFMSSDGKIRFNYPQEWNQESLGAAELGPNVIESSTISNYVPNQGVSGGFPENGVRIDVVIAKDGEKGTTVIECEMKATVCESVEINGHTFNKSEATLNTGFISKTIATNLNGNRVKVTYLIGNGTEQGANESTIDKIISSITIQP